MIVNILKERYNRTITNMVCLEGEKNMEKIEKGLRQREFMVMGKNLPWAYHKALIALHNYGIEVPSNYNTNQREISMKMVVNHPLCEPMISRLAFTDPKSLEQYRQEILDGILDFEVDYGNWEYTYHRLIESQIPWAIDKLTNPTFGDIYSRQAAISLPTEETRKLASPPCLQNIQYLIRPDEDGELLLHCGVLFRSNDAPKATFMNAFGLIMLQERMAKEISAILGCEIKVGQYTHNANSFHVYERDYEMLKGYVNRIKNQSDLTYDYVGDWDEQMADERENIAKLVLDLKNRPKKIVKQIG